MSSSSTVPQTMAQPSVPGDHLVPVLRFYTDGAVFDFGSHANDFLLAREDGLATETFLTRVPGNGTVPEHVHTDMEQTFLFVSGVGRAQLTHDGTTIEYLCRPGHMLFVPTGWHHSVAAASIEGVAYVTVNAFLPGVDRVGDSATDHADIAAEGFQQRGLGNAQTLQTDATAVLRCAELAFRVPAGARQAWPQDFAALDATLTRDPNTYRVLRTGPFEVVVDVDPVPRILTPELANRLHAAATTAGQLNVWVKGSQSPISVKQPCPTSDLDVLVTIRHPDELPTARAMLDAVRTVETPVALSPSIAQADWLRLPGFYSALSLDPQSPDRAWWHAPTEALHAEAVQRQTTAQSILTDLSGLNTMLSNSIQASDHPLARYATAGQEWRLGPRWIGL